MAPASAPRSVPSPRLSEKLIRTLLRYEAAIEAFPLTSAEQTRLEQMRTELATNPQRFFADCRPFRSPLLTNASDRRPADRHGLEQHELQQLDQDGFLPPRPVPGAKAIIEGAESLLGIYARTGQHSGLMQHLHLYHPRASAALIDNIDFFIDQAMSIFDTSRDRLLIDTQVFSSRLPAPIHTDYPAEQFFDLDRLPRMPHFHVNLRMPPGARGL